MAMPQTTPWTIADLERLPDDGNRYEVLDGALFVTPAPSDVHQEIVDWLSAAITPFVTAHGLGRVRHPRSVIQAGGSQLEPDLMVRPIAPLRGWDKAPLPILVIEVLSVSTRQRDLVEKRDFYTRSGVPEYWVVDRYTQSVLQVRGDRFDRLTDRIVWSPAGLAAELAIDLARMFRETRPATGEE